MNDLVFSKARSKLEEYNYPAELCEVIMRFSQCMRGQLMSFNPGVLLVGSTSRGELSWSNKSGHIQLFSDIEFLVAVNKHDAHKEHALRQMISKLESEYDFGKLFHIDFTVIAWDKLPKLEKKFFIFESKQYGIDLTNVSVRAELPVVSRTNINWKELNEVLLHRMTSILHAVPESLLSSTMSDEEKITLGLSIAKNTLDITTWLHPYEADKLVAGFTSRLASWDKAFLAERKIGDFLSSDDIDYMKMCLALRQSPNLTFDIIEMMHKTLSLYHKSISYCKAMNEIDEKTSIGDAIPSIKLFDEYSIRQRASQLISMLVNISTIGISKMIRNSIGVRKGIAINICRYLLLAANDYVKEASTANQNLKMAHYELSRLVKVEDIQEVDFAKAWNSLRDSFKQYQDITHNY